MIFCSVKWDLSIKLVRVQLFMAVNSPEPRVRIFHGFGAARKLQMELRRSCVWLCNESVPFDGTGLHFDVTGLGWKFVTDGSLYLSRPAVR